MRKAPRHRRAGAEIGRIEKTKREFGVVTFLIGGMGRLLHVKFGEHAQERRTDVRLARHTKTDEAVQPPVVWALHHASLDGSHPVERRQRIKLVARRYRSVNLACRLIAGDIAHAHPSIRFWPATEE